MSRENYLWGAPRLHGELLKLGLDICESTIAKYMVRRTGPPSQPWRTFIRNHLPDLVAVDFFTVHTATFNSQTQSFSWSKDPAIEDIRGRMNIQEGHRV